MLNKIKKRQLKPIDTINFNYRFFEKQLKNIALFTNPAPSIQYIADEPSESLHPATAGFRYTSRHQLNPQQSYARYTMAPRVHIFDLYASQHTGRLPIVEAKRLIG